MAVKRIIIALFLTFFLGVCFFVGNIPSNLYNSISNKWARVDIFNTGQSGASIFIDDLENTSFPDWCKQENRGCVTVNKHIGKKWKEFIIKGNAIQDGTLTVFLKGPWTKVNEKTLAVLVDYKDVYVNNKLVLKKGADIWHDKPFTHQESIKNGQNFTVRFKARKYHLRIRDIKSIVKNVHGEILFSLTIFFFLFFYKMLEYCSKFKINKNYSVSNILFLIGFFVLLFIPMSHISQEEKSVKENRALAKYQPLFTNGHINLRFGTMFEQWFNDRFFGREFALYFYNKVKYYIAPLSGSDKVLVGKDNWLFYKPNNSLNNYANQTTLSQNELEKGLAFLKSIDDWCKKNGKEFYYVIAPDKNKIYGEYYRLIKKQRDDSFSLGNQFANYIKKHSDIKVIYLYDTLIKNKGEDLLYWKTDTHWNHYGAYFGYKELMNTMNRPITPHDFVKMPYQGDLARALSYVIPKDKTQYKWIKGLKPFCKTSDQRCVNPDKKTKVFMIRDSFASALLDFLAYDFNEIKTIHHDTLNSFNDFNSIKQNFDIVILENVERLTPQIISKKPFPKD